MRSEEESSHERLLFSFDMRWPRYFFFFKGVRKSLSFFGGVVRWPPSFGGVGWPPSFGGVRWPPLSFEGYARWSFGGYYVRGSSFGGHVRWPSLRFGGPRRPFAPGGAGCA